ncbi:ATP-dependent helicase HrpB [Psychromonas sp. RZ22]|uniref:ATP-dependent helicase HrpB n=1 Tax=Psychromonas algarum TaxID=2555643 RepID=UPI0010681346|nr:ATP-dependent helicase HrpB [Psychromonas sp. RZ22]TEW53774.1 ATP-dependent helicase HrpB [Psychromonas sp. RZ22]
MLPVHAVLTELKQQLIHNPQVILQAPPGAGKSTYLPLVLLKEQWFTGKIIMLEPRRLAARNIAHYLAEQLGQPIGKQVGYRLRGESKVSQTTQLEIVTEGILIRLLQKDPELNGIDLVIFDEFHERNVQADLGLALCLDSQASLREDLSLLIMSATLNNQSLQQHLPEATCVNCKGRMYPIEYIYQKPSNERLKQGIQYNQQKAFITLIQTAYQQQQGNILVFVAGVKEILNCCSDLQDWIRINNLPVLLAPLYGQLSLEQQQLAIQPAPNNKRKIVIATNIAETSLTIDGITVVVDSGIERSFQFQPQTGIGKLISQTISEASATQRAGRAGRLSAGTCYRLWSKEKRLTAQNEVPILQSDLTSLILEISAWGVNHPSQLPFLTQPNEKHVQVAQILLQKIGALDNNARCTTHGEKIIDLALSPRLGHMLITAKNLEGQLKQPGLVALACLLAAFLESNEKSSDDIMTELLSPSFQVKKQYQVLLKKCAIKAPIVLPFTYCGVLLAIAFPDRIALKRGNAQQFDYQLSNGVGACLSHHSVLLNEKMLVVADLALSAQQTNSLIFKACAISLEEIKTLLAHYLISIDYLSWSLKENKLIAEQRLMLGKIVLSRSPLRKVTNTQKREALLNGLRQTGLSMLYWSEQNKVLLTRLRYAYLQSQLIQNNDFVDFSEAILIEQLDQWLAPFCVGITQLEQLKKIDLKAALLSRLTWQKQKMLDQLFPEKLAVPTGSLIKLEYREQHNPLLSVKMQELYGQADTPSIFNGTIAVQLALLSPSMKPLQVTQNLSSFWSGAYKEVQKEMKGRYPKHFWPDDPAKAVATRRTKKYISSEKK